MSRMPMTKSQFLETMRVERQRWEEALFAIGEERMMTPGLVGDWSARDVVAHTTEYERWLVAWLEATARGELARPTALDDSDAGRGERAALELTRAFPLDLTLGDSWLTWERLWVAVERLSEEELADAGRAPQFVRRRWNATTALWQVIAHLTYEHYREHLPAFHAWAREASTCCAG